MGKYDCELFGHFLYSPEYSYDELYEIEEKVIQLVQEHLEEHNADHLDFWGAGDSLRFQCALGEYEQETCQDVADAIADQLPEGVHGRILSLDKNLEKMVIFFVRPGDWREQAYTFEEQEE